MDFSKFKLVKPAQVRKSTKGATREQSYTDLKFRKGISEKGKTTSISSLFYLSTSKFESLGVSVDKGLIDFVNPANPNEVFIGIVAEKDAFYLKSRKKFKKGRVFKSTTLEASLNTAGIIDSSEASYGKNQIVTMTLASENVDIEGVNVEKVFLLAKGVEVKRAKKEVVAAPGKSEAPVASAPAATETADPAPTATVAADETEWN